MADDQRDPWGQSPPPKSSPGNLYLWLALMIGVTALVGFLMWRYSYMISSDLDRGNLLYMVALLALVSSSLLFGRRIRLGHAAKMAAAWIGVALVLVLGYTYRFEIGTVGDRLLGAILPHHGTQIGEGEIAFQAGEDGHFQVEATVDGMPVLFLVDTGASRVVLSPADARRLGFDPGKLDYRGIASTANGLVRTARVRLGSIELGHIRIEDLPASVNQAAMSRSLLGMEFLSRLASFEVRDDRLIMRW